jgi:3-phosphoshikimate 1-carboxyvinyltransferase
MQMALNGAEEVIDIHHAGTARFTAYFAVQENRTVTLTGSSRMQERPIKILVEALEQLGAKISYLSSRLSSNPNKGSKNKKSKVTMAADVSSQYISALLLVASNLENGIELTLEGEITSVPYIKMTLALLNDLDIQTSFVGNKITVIPRQQVEQKL